MIVSIISVNYNNISGLKKTLDSVICQTCNDYEWIVIDGGSTDGSRELLEQYSDNITYWISESDHGIYEAMNKGIRVAKGGYLQFLNSGDSLADKDIIKRFCERRTTEDVIYGNAIIVDGNNCEVKRFKAPDNIKFSYFFGHALNHQATFFSKRCFKNYLYNEENRIASDIELYMYLMYYHFTFQKWDEYIVRFDNSGLSSKKAKDEFTGIVDRILPRAIKADYQELIQFRDVDLAIMIKKIINYYKEKGLEKDLDYYIQTNCVLLTEDKIKFFKENDVKISISIDGNNRFSNRCRILADNKNSITYIKKAINLLNKNKVKINALAVLNIYNYNKISDIIDFYVENNIYDFSFNYFIKGGRGNENSYLAISNEQLLEATKNIIDKIEEYYKKGIMLNEKNVYYITKMFKTGKKSYMCANSPCGAGLNIFGITPNGDIFPCDDLSSVDKFCLGNINETPLDEILESPVINYFAGCNYSKIEECKNCEIKSYCGAGCCSRKYYDTDSIYSKDPICGFYKLLYPYMKEKLKTGLIGKIYE